MDTKLRAEVNARLQTHAVTRDRHAIAGCQKQSDLNAAVVGALEWVLTLLDDPGQYPHVAPARDCGCGRDDCPKQHGITLRPREQPFASLEAQDVITEALKRLHDAVLAAWGDPEDCEDCGARDNYADLDGPCALHGSAHIYAAIIEARRVLGPCPCGHDVDAHDVEDTTRCKSCDCKYFRLPAALDDRTEGR